MEIAGGRAIVFLCADTCQDYEFSPGIIGANTLHWHESAQPIHSALNFRF
jgi:hypothetical protein